MVKTAIDRQSFEAMKVPHGRAPHDLGSFTYQVIANPTAEARRSSERRRLRFQTGKLADAEGRFISECLIHDRSSRGLRICLARDVAVPLAFSLYLDQDGEMLGLRAVWRRGTMMGAAFASENAVGRSRRQSLGAPLYAFRR